MKIVQLLALCLFLGVSQWMHAQISSTFTQKSPLAALTNSRSAYIDLPYFALLPKVKYEFGSISSINLGLSWIDYGADDILDDVPAWYHHGPSIETGISFKDKNQYMINKIGYDCFILIFGGRVNLVHQTDFSQHQFSLRPELGLSFFSYLTFTYGYNWNLNKSSLGLTNGHVFSLNLAYVITYGED